MNPRDNNLKITPDGNHIVFTGNKHFNIGGVVSDLTVLEGILNGTQDRIFALAETQQPGIQFAHNWHNIGLRLTEFGKHEDRECPCFLVRCTGLGCSYQEASR